MCAIQDGQQHSQVEDGPKLSRVIVSVMIAIQDVKQKIDLNCVKW